MYGKLARYARSKSSKALSLNSSSAMSYQWLIVGLTEVVFPNVCGILRRRGLIFAFYTVFTHPVSLEALRTDVPVQW